MNEANAKKKNLTEIVKFCSIGAFNTVLDYVLFFLFFSILNINKTMAQVFATAIAMTNSYVFNRYWTFGRRGMIRADEIIKFVVVNFVAMSVTIICLHLFYDFLHAECLVNYLLSLTNISYRLSGDSSVMFCKLISMPFSLIVNFLGNRLWVFKKNSDKKEQNPL